MIRREDWPERLTAYIKETRREAFAWGTRDCLSWVNGAIERMTDSTVFDALLGAYNDEESARELVIQQGGWIQGIDAIMVGARIEAVLAQRGDVVLLSNDFTVPGWDHSLGLCVGEVAIGVGVKELQRVPMSLAVMAWRV